MIFVVGIRRLKDDELKKIKHEIELGKAEAPT
jgi:hypothetical protein